MKIYLFAFIAITSLVLGSASNQANAQTDVVAFWHFEDYDERPTVEAQDVAGLAGRFTLDADVNNTGSTAGLEVFLGNAGNLDGNGGGGFLPYTSPVSGASFGTTRTIRFDDLAGGGPEFSLGGNDQFSVDRNDGAGAVTDDFGDDALLYFTIDGSGFQDFEIRFDVEATPFNDEPDDPAVPEPFLPESFDVFYRTTPGGTWFRDVNQNNVSLIPDGLPTDLDNQNLVIDPDGDGIVNPLEDQFVSLSAALDNAPFIEIIINDFNEGDGNGELEIDNIEIVANVIATIPEPSSACLLTLAMLGFAGRRRR